MSAEDDHEALRRWRLVLGRYAQRNLNPDLSPREQRMDRALDYLYRRELQQRGVRTRGGKVRPGSLDATALTPLGWLGEARNLFPASVFETVQAHALERYRMTDLLKDPRAVERLPADPGLLKAVMGMSGRADPAMQTAIRTLARRVVEDIMKRLRARVQQAFSGAPNRFRRGQIKTMQNFDWRATVRENLKHYSKEHRAMVAQRLLFNSRVKRNMPWNIVLCVDQSGSMLDSVIHAAVMAAILNALPSLHMHLVLFDTAVVDLSDRVDDPVEVLMSVQLGGGTDIGSAVQYCEGLIQQPDRTIFVLLSDFCEGAPLRPLLAATKRLAEARVKLLGLIALDAESQPFYDHRIAERLSGLGMEIAALTPEHFAQWLAEVIQ